MAGIVKATRLRSGNLVLIDGDLYRVHSVEHRTPGKGNACMQTKLRNLATGNMIDKRFNSDDKVEKASLDTAQMEFLYEDETGFIFMDTNSYEQITLNQEMIGDDKGYLLSNTKVKVEFYDGKPVGLELPLTVVLRVEETEPFVKRATASAQVKPATMETGLRVTIPGFVESGDLVKINTETGDYVSRVNSYDE